MVTKKIYQKLLTLAAAVSAFASVGALHNVKAENTVSNYGYVIPMDADFNSPAQNSSSSTNTISSTVDLDLNVNGAYRVYLVTFADPASDLDGGPNLAYFNIVSEIKEVMGDTVVTFDQVKLLYPVSKLHCYFEAVNPLPDDPKPTGFCGSFAAYNGGPNNTLTVNYTGSETPIFRFYNPQAGGHFYTANREERLAVDRDHPDTVWKHEGVSYFSSTIKNDSTCAEGLTQVYRFYNPSAKHHFYTITAAERDELINTNPNWTYEGPTFCGSNTKQSGMTEVYRFFNPSKVTHFYTTNAAEKDQIIATDPNWNFEGTAYYAKI